MFIFFQHSINHLVQYLNMFLGFVMSPTYYQLHTFYDDNKMKYIDRK